MDPTPLEVLIGNLGEVLTFGFAQIVHVFNLVMDTPLLLVAVGFSVFGIVVKYGKKMLRL